MMNNELLQTLIIFFVLGLVSLNALTYYSNKIMLFPDIIWILLLGLLYSGLSHYAVIDIPQVSLDADFILYAFVPLLIFASTQKICLFHLKKVLLPSSIIASVGILISMLIIAVPLFVAFDFGHPIKWGPSQIQAETDCLIFSHCQNHLVSFTVVVTSLGIMS